MILKAIILGIIEGLTEFIPVSSTGHLVLVSNYLTFAPHLEKTFDIFIQLGAILAVVVLYLKTFLALIPSKKHHGPLEGFDGLIKLFLTALPAGVVGLLCYRQIKQHLMAPLPIAVALIIGGILLILVEKRSKAIRITDYKEVSYRDCFLLGCFQIASLWPGMSRSGSTIIGARLLDFDRQVAAKFSFIMAVPLISAAAIYDLIKTAATLSLTTDDYLLLLIGFAVSFIVAIAAMKLFLNLLKRFTLKGFGYYRIALGLLILILLL